MTEQTIRLPGVSDETQALVTGLHKKLADATPRNEILSAYYDMHRAVRQVSNVLPPMYRGLSMTLGWTAKGVDALARRCVLTGFSWPDGDLDSLGASALWDGNSLGSEARQGGLESLIHGPSFIVTTRGGDGEPPALIHFKSALDATGDWNARARRMDNLLSITDRDDKGNTTGLVLYQDGVTLTAVKDGAKWMVDEQDHPWGVPVDPMVYKPRLRRAFGSSRISRAARGLQDGAVRELLRLEGHMDTYSFPEMWLLGADESVFKDANGVIKPVWQVMLGRIKGIPDDQDQDEPALARADVKQFAAASPEPHLADLNALAKLFAREMSLPDTSLAITDVSNPTSEGSYDSSQHELVTEAEGTVEDWSPALRHAHARSLAIANDLSEIPAEWASIAPRWRKPRFRSQAEEADAGVKQLSAAPWLAETRVGLSLLGMTEQQIDDALGERQRIEARARMDTLVSVGASSADASAVKAQADALGVLIRAGVEPADAARRVGLDGAQFTGAVPVSLRLPTVDATSLEGA